MKISERIKSLSEWDAENPIVSWRQIIDGRRYEQLGILRGWVLRAFSNWMKGWGISRPVRFYYLRMVANESEANHILD